MASSTTTYENVHSCTPREALRLVITRGGRGAVHKLGNWPEPRHQVLAWLDGRGAASAVSIVRAQVRDFLAASKLSISADLIDDVVLCTSEVVTNALVHTESRIVVVRLVTLADSARGAVVTAAVGDEDCTRPVKRPSEQDCAAAVNGRGLALLTALSRWGCRTWGGGKDVWFVCPLPEPSSQI